MHREHKRRPKRQEGLREQVPPQPEARPRVHDRLGIEPLAQRAVHQVGGAAKARRELQGRPAAASAAGWQPDSTAATRRAAAASAAARWLAATQQL